MTTAISIISSDMSQLEQSLCAIGLGTIADVLPALQAEVKNETSWRVYKQDIKSFASWIYTEQIDLASINRIDLQNYRKHLHEQGYSNISINRMFSVVRLVVAELVSSGVLVQSPLEKKFKPLPTNNETTHVALDAKQSMQLLATIDRTTIKGKRDYALVSLMLRCGLRRDECRMLNIGDIGMKQGHYVLDIKDGKGGKPATVKLPPDVWREIETYQQSFKRSATLNTPLFVSFRKGDYPTANRIDTKAIETVVKALGVQIGTPGLTPHGLRATFITLALENKATLTETQYAARHADPRTTERYQKRKMNLDNNAVDKLSFLARED